LKLKCDEPLSNVAFNFNSRRYTAAAAEPVYHEFPHDPQMVPGRGLHPSTSQLNLNRFYH
jgi:hypothetical protein